MGRWQIPDPPEVLPLPDTHPGTVSAAEAARLYGVSRSVVCRWLSQGRLPGAEQRGRSWCVPIPLPPRPSSKSA